MPPTNHTPFFSYSPFTARPPEPARKILILHQGPCVAVVVWVKVLPDWVRGLDFAFAFLGWVRGGMGVGRRGCETYLGGGRRFLPLRLSFLLSLVLMMRGFVRFGSVRSWVCWVLWCIRSRSFGILLESRLELCASSSCEVRRFLALGWVCCSCWSCSCCCCCCCCCRVSWWWRCWWSLVRMLPKVAVVKALCLETAKHRHH